MDEQTKDQTRYTKLNRFLLHLLSIELGYFVLLIFGGVIVAILAYKIDFLSDVLYDYDSAIFWPVLLFIITLPINMIGGFISIMLNIRLKHEGYPGTGHLLNWIFLMTTGWLFILAIVFMIPSMARGY